MPKSSIHTQTAKQENRDQFGKFINTKNLPSTFPPSSPSSPNLPILTLLWNKLSKLSLKKLTTMIAFISLIATNSLSLTIIERLSPHSSPVFHRSTAHQGILKTLGDGQYVLSLPDGQSYTLYLKPASNLNNLKNLKEVVVKGNLTFTPYVIENAEIYPVNISTP